MKFPDKKTLSKIRKQLENAEGSLALPSNATPLQKLKYEICKQFVIFKREQNLNNRELSKILNIDESLTSKILRYNIDRFTTDKLIELLSRIHPNHRLILKVS